MKDKHKGTVQVRLKIPTHRKVKVLAAENDTDINGAVELLLAHGKSTRTSGKQ